MVEAHATYMDAKTNFGGLKTAFEALKAAYKTRAIRWKAFQDVISRRCRHEFTKLLSVRGFHGQLIFNHVKQTLKTNVRGADAAGLDSRAASQAIAKDAKTLSGGESASDEGRESS